MEYYVVDGVVYFNRKEATEANQNKDRTGEE